MMPENVVEILGGLRRDLENNQSVFFLPQTFGNYKIAVGATDDDGFLDGW